MKTPDEVIFAIARFTTLTKDDVEGLGKLDPNQAALVMKTYEDAGKVSDRGLWVKIGELLKQAGEYASIAGIIFSAIPLL